MTQIVHTVQGPRIADAFGHMVLSAQQARARGYDGVIPEVLEFEDGYVLVNDAQRYFESYPSWPDIQRLACDRAKGRVLDIGAGAGRHLAYLQHDRGLPAVGIDSSPGAVEVLTAAGLQAHRIDIRDLSNHVDLGPFDTILMLGGNLGLLGTMDNAGHVLDKLAAVSHSDTVLLGECGYRALWRHGDDHRPLRMRSRFEDMATEWFEYLTIDPGELPELTALSTAWELADVELSDQCSLITLRRRS